MDTDYKVGTVVLDNEPDALTLVERLKQRVAKYGQITVGELYDLVGVSSTFTDEKWGWDDLSTLTIGRSRGWVLNLPAPKHL